jgi:signal transduction histidine kinase
VSIANKLMSIFIDGGIVPSDSISRARSIRLGNLISVIAIGNTLILALVLLIIGDFTLLLMTLVGTFLYLFCYLLGIFASPDIGRPAIIIAGNAVIFYFSCIFRGEANFQIFYFSLAVAPFMFFSWQEKNYYVLTLFTVLLYVVGELWDWNFFYKFPHNYNLRPFRIVSIIGTMNTIVLGFFYHLRQSAQFEAEGREYLAQLEFENKRQVQLQKMSSLGEMAGGISHEINNPLMVIAGKSTMLRRELKNRCPDEDSAYRHLDKINEMVFRISKIINALRYFACCKSDFMPAEKVLVRNMLEIALDVCKERFISQSVKLHVEIPENLNVTCHKAEISQVLLNLLNNAFDACVSQPSPLIWVTARDYKDKVEILVEDNGFGISADIEHKIMQPFFTTKEVGRGTGLGLSLCKGLVEAHNGSLTLIHNTGKTTFQILLPRVPIRP